MTDGSNKIGPYTILSRLDAGGMATVFVGTRYDRHGRVAIKLMHEHLAHDQRYYKMFLDETMIHQSLKDENIVSFFDQGEHQRVVNGERVDQPYLAMEYIHGQPLDMVIDQVRHLEVLPPLWISLVAYITSRIARGLHHLHELLDHEGRPRNAIHRDVSPHNILISYDGVVKLSDFGLVKAQRRVFQTETGILKGKYAYVSPEQITLAKGEHLDRRSDIFSLGIVLWESTLLRRLFLRNDDLKTMMAIVHDSVSPPGEKYHGFSPELERIVLKALEKKREQRYSSALSLAQDLEAYLTHLPGHKVIGREQVAELMQRLFKPTMLPPLHDEATLDIDGPTIADFGEGQGAFYTDTEDDDVGTFEHPPFEAGDTTSPTARDGEGLIASRAGGPAIDTSGVDGAQIQDAHGGTRVMTPRMAPQLEPIGDVPSGLPGEETTWEDTYETAAGSGGDTDELSPTGPEASDADEPATWEKAFGSPEFMDDEVSAETQTWVRGSHPGEQVETEVFWQDELPLSPKPRAEPSPYSPVPQPQPVDQLDRLRTDEYLSDEMTEPTPPILLTRRKKKKKHNGRAIKIAALFLLALAIAGAVVLLFLLRQERLQLRQGTLGDIPSLQLGQEHPR